MSSKTTYKCDVCKSKIRESDVLRVNIIGDDVCDGLELCSWKCLKKYVDERSK